MEVLTVEYTNEREQNIILYNRKRIELTGISDVSAFSESEVEVEYPGGSIAIEGENLKIDGFSSETGVLNINGIINGFFYFGRAGKARKNKRGQ